MCIGALDGGAGGGDGFIASLGTGVNWSRFFLAHENSPHLNRREHHCLSRVVNQFVCKPARGHNRDYSIR